jgi:hypothetical protein
MRCRWRYRGRSMVLDVEQLERWVMFGALWKAVELSDHEVVVEFFSCTGEVIERRSSRDRAVIDHVRGAPAAPSD